MHSEFIKGCNSINISWSPPTRNASGRPVTEYLVQIKPARSVDPWINCTVYKNLHSTSCMCTSLKANSSYDVRVTAKNKLGYGWPSEIMEASTITGDFKRISRPEV